VDIVYAFLRSTHSVRLKKARRMMEADVQVLELPALSQQRPVTRWRPLWLFIKRKSLGAIGAGLLAIFVAMAILAPAQATHDPDLNDYRARVKPPSAQHCFGTDNFGRDMYSRVVYGVRISIYVGVLSPLLGTALGAFAGLLSGFFGGHIDQLIQRLADVMFTIPPLVLAMAIVTMLSLSLINVVISFPRLPNTNRVIRSAVLSARESLYVEASSALGCSNWRIRLRHLLPNVTAPIIVVVTAGLGGAILVEASLSFLGLGVPPPAPS
jgi:peptide/nickel transport system permease protein